LLAEVPQGNVYSKATRIRVHNTDIKVLPALDAKKTVTETCLDFLNAEL
jgi:hypothetical protein